MCKEWKQSQIIKNSALVLLNKPKTKENNIAKFTYKLFNFCNGASL